MAESLLLQLGATTASLALVLACVGIGRSQASTGDCGPVVATSAYAAEVAAATNSGHDQWGESLLASPQGPTYESARRFLAPLLLGIQRGRRPLTASGVYYLPFALPTSVRAAKAFALHVADGSQIITRRIGGPTLTVYVGSAGRERYGACLRRLTPPKLADGYLPIVQTAYVDAAGVRYRQESFAAHRPGTQSLISFIRLRADARSASHGTVIHFASSSSQRFVGTSRRIRVNRGQVIDVVAEWLHAPRASGRTRINFHAYALARARVRAYWRRRLSLGTQLVVPEKRVMDAERAILIQQMTQGWRYSVGNPYEELSFAEALDTAEVMAAYGYHDQARAILQFSLQRLPRRFTIWRAGERLLAAATYFQLFRDRKLVDREATPLSRVLDAVLRRRIRSGVAAGRFAPEPLCSDVPDEVDSVPAQVVVWQGLLAMDRVWAVTGHPKLAARARAIALRLEAPLRRAVRASAMPLRDGSLFVPEVFSRGTGPYDRLTSSRDGSYWNLVMPYAFASGFFAPGGRDARGVLRYLLAHGSRLLGVTRADAHIVYGRWIIGDGLGQVYGLNVSRFLADNDAADQLTLSLYGMLAVGMTPETFISGEAISVAPVEGAYYRTMYMPPNLGANSTYLETLRLLLVHERRGPRGAPRGLDLAFSTPRRWLRSGSAIRVDRAPTSFGLLSFSIVRHGVAVSIRVDAPPGAKDVRIRLRLPRGEHVRSVRSGRVRVPFAAAPATIRVPSGRVSILVAVVR